MEIMKGLFNELQRLGVTIADLERVSGLSYTTLRKMNDGDHVREVSVSKAQRALRKIKHNLVDRKLNVKTA